MRVRVPNSILTICSCCCRQCLYSRHHTITTAIIVHAWILVANPRPSLEPRLVFWLGSGCGGGISCCPKQGWADVDRCLSRHRTLTSEWMRVIPPASTPLHFWWWWPWHVKVSVGAVLPVEWLICSCIESGGASDTINGGGMKCLWYYQEYCFSCFNGDMWSVIFQGRGIHLWNIHWQGVRIGGDFLGGRIS